MWQPVSEALAVALQHQTAVAWPIVISHLAYVQGELLAGNGASIIPGIPSLPGSLVQMFAWTLLNPLDRALPEIWNH